MKDVIIVTGGAGFIGSNFVHQWIATETATIVNLDKLTYAGSMLNLGDLNSSGRHVFERGDIAESDRIRKLLNTYQPYAIVHFAAESHVDRSIDSPDAFIQTNVVGTYRLLEEGRRYWQGLDREEKTRFRFVHISTDEVYGSLGPRDPAFSESTPYSPNSPYSASKASSDHLVRAYYHTYGFPTVTTNCSNNYGPYQCPEKLIPLTILNCVRGSKIPVYGDGLNVRDWLYVEDHCHAIRTVLRKGRPGETYNVGGGSERANIEVVRRVCSLVDELRPTAHGRCEALIRFVKDRPGHDRRYAVDTTKISTELGWKPLMDFTSGMRRTVEWYLANQDWVQHVTSGEYRDWVNKQHTTA